MSLGQITSRQAVLDAVAEFDSCGRRKFLERYGFNAAKSYYLKIGEKHYDSKSIAGVAHKHQVPSLGALTPSQFGGGKNTVKPLLEKLGFTVVRKLKEPVG